MLVIFQSETFRAPLSKVLDENFQGLAPLCSYIVWSTSVIMRENISFHYI